MIVDRVLYNEESMSRAMNRMIDNKGRELLIGYLLLHDDLHYYGFELGESYIVSPLMLYDRSRHSVFYPSYIDNGYDIILQCLACDDGCFYFQCGSYSQVKMIIAAMRYMPKKDTTFDWLHAMNAMVQN